jgi:hypothetical protein
MPGRVRKSRLDQVAIFGLFQLQDTLYRASFAQKKEKTLITQLCYSENNILFVAFKYADTAAEECTIITCFQLNV